MSHHTAPHDLEPALRACLQDPNRLKLQERLANYTTFKIGGPAQFFATVHTAAELSALLTRTHRSGARASILGNGSNLLVSDQGVPGVVIQLEGDFATYTRAGTTVRAGAGHNLPKLAVQISKAGLSGLEFAVGIPGTVGAGLVINAGAHGGELIQVVTSVQVVWPDGRLVELPAEQLGLRYRGSDLQGTGAIVTAVSLQLQAGEPEDIAAKVSHNLEYRRKTQPLLQPNAGSIFKNPPGHFAGRLIEAAELKGCQVGQAQVSEKHANFIVNLGGATAADVLQLMAHVRQKVEALSGVRLVNEVQIWGENPYF